MKQVVLLGLLSLFLFTGCHTYGGGVIVSGSYSHGHNAPPAHAPAHGRRQQHRYHYYPNAEFYFDVGRNMYFYLDSRARWTFSVNLPFRLRSHLHNNYVEIEMGDDRPYRRHKYYKNKYKKHKTRYKRNNKARHKVKKSKKKHKKYRDDEENDNRRYKNGRRYDRD
ncbi:MAG: hypothetical protein KAJ39_05700 [Gammaproteobacteria bacterium]|nr:hypothetical protein [Gammaproteobacteria bacterium]